MNATSALCWVTFLVQLLSMTVSVTSSDKKHFLSVLVRFHNAASSILEFMQHYYEEGVDHFFFFDDRSTDNTLEVLKCVKDNYRVYNHQNLGMPLPKQPHEQVPDEVVYHRMYQQAGIQDKTEWLILVDIDEYITSRATPHLTIRDVITTQAMSECGIISVPSIMYSWTGVVHTPRNNVRNTLRYRWGYDKQYAIPSVPDHSPFRNTYMSTENKMIIRTSTVPTYKGTKHAYFSGSDGGLLCVPRINGPMACAADLSISQLQSYAAVKQSPEKNHGRYTDLTGGRTAVGVDAGAGLHRWCPFSNRFVSTQAPTLTYLQEEDIDNMQLISFHYRIRSLQDWDERYPKPEHATYEADRPDIYDDFMSNKRALNRRDHPAMAAAAARFDTCSHWYYDTDAVPVPPPEELLLHTNISTLNRASKVQLNDLQVQLRSHYESLQNYEFFLSVMVFARDESGVVLELMRHYIEEGADHIFLFDDDSTDGMGSDALACVDPKYYTVYNRASFESKKRLSQHQGYTKMYIDRKVRHRTKWLAVVDADEFISSRILPQMTIRELLHANLQDCGIVSIPWILFSWGNQSTDPHNKFRETLHYRMGYDRKYNRKAPENSKFHERWNGESNKVIFQTAKVGDYQQTHNARFSDSQNGDLVCIPSTQPMLKCAADIAHKLDLDRFRAAPCVPDKVYLDVDGKSQGLPQFCPFGNRFIGVRSTYRTWINEADIPNLLLGCFHYRVKSQEDWNRKTLGERFNAWEYEGQKVEFANRVDIFDDFMVAVRQPARANHPDFVKADTMFSSCDPKYYYQGILG